ncbi:MAG TPA: hypothetical protein VFT43_04795 [Candidatus Polarisedimenticolia bacterium]|nr:hypothetical protein [Candidatus Polarisedimenticolia bacterium]
MTAISPTAVGWFWIGAGAAKGLGIAAYLWVLGRAGGFETPAPGWFGGVASLLSRHLIPFAVGWAALGAFMVVSGVFLRRRRPWARMGLEVVCWFGLFEAPTVALLLYGVSTTVRHAHLASADRLAPLLCLGIWICVAWLSIYLISLALLRSRTVRGWFPLAGTVRGGQGRPPA